MAKEESPNVEEEVQGAVNALIEDDEPFEDDLEDDLDEADQEEKEEVSPSESLEEVAKELGWNPDYKGNDAMTASEFIRKGDKLRQTARDGLKSTQRKLDSMNQAIMDIKKHYAATTEAQERKYQKQLTELRKRKREAIEEGDPEEVDRIEGEMMDVYGSLEKPEREPETPKADPEDLRLWDEWRKDNDWYDPTGTGGDIERTLFADEEAAKLERYPGLPYQRKLEIVTQKVKERFSPKGATRPTVTPVESPSNTRTKRQVAERDLPPEARSVMRNLVKSGHMTKQEFIKDWALQQEA